MVGIGSRSKKVTNHPVVNRELTIDELKAALAKEKEKNRLLTIQLRSMDSANPEEASLAQSAVDKETATVSQQGEADAAADAYDGTAHAGVLKVSKKGPLMVSLGLYASKLAATKSLSSQLEDMRAAMNELMDDLVRFKQEAEYYRGKYKQSRSSMSALQEGNRQQRAETNGLSQDSGRGGVDRLVDAVLSGAPTESWTSALVPNSTTTNAANSQNSTHDGSAGPMKAVVSTPLDAASTNNHPFSNSEQPPESVIGGRLGLVTSSARPSNAKNVGSQVKRAPSASTQSYNRAPLSTSNRAVQNRPASASGLKSSTGSAVVKAAQLNKGRPTSAANQLRPTMKAADRNGTHF